MRWTAGSLTLLFLFTAVGASPALAASRSKTVTVSCVIAPQIGLASPRPSAAASYGDGSSDAVSVRSGRLSLSSDGSVRVLGNLGRSYRLQEELLSRGDGPAVKLITVTAL
ncbi:MAG: hypothetical protein MOGMAGMI_01489 [Candidatus Omnitrophica bacterium]|nr:hypothetical protein [Candidatus Omnitrophota bacterium]